MPRLKDTTLPTYRRHRGSGQACVTLNGVTFYLGRYGTKESRSAYDRRIAEWITNGREVATPEEPITVAEVYSQFRDHARSYYGQESRTPENIAEAMRVVLRLYGLCPADEFRATCLKAVRQSWIDDGRVRTNVNRLCNLVKQVFGWAASEELIDAGVDASLKTVKALKKGRCDASESQPVRPVPLEQVERVLPYRLSSAVRRWRTPGSVVGAPQG